MNTWFILAIFAVLSIFAACISLLMPQKKAPLIDSDNNRGQDTYSQYKTYTDYTKDDIIQRKITASLARGSVSLTMGNYFTPEQSLQRKKQVLDFTFKA